MKILVVDDDPYVCDLLKTFLTKNMHEVDVCHNGKDGVSALKNGDYDLAFVDLVMPELDGVGVIEKCKELNIATKIIIITAFASIETAIKAIKLGAYDYISKPFNLEEINLIINKIKEYSLLLDENIALKEKLKYYLDDNDLIGNSQAMQKVFSMINKVANTDATVLITGESGTGKEVIAKAIHYKSSRANKPFIPVNCAAIPKDLLESELFGYEKGAFTGANNSRIGRFERANGGTILLDEIGDLHISLQAKILRVIQEKEIERVGGTTPIKIDVRIIAATNKNLEEEVKNGNFRQDLFYRLNVIPIVVPPLKDRIDDIPLLTKYFIMKFSKKRKIKRLQIDPKVMNCLLSYDWPGNVRELENLIERISILDDDGIITLDDLPQKISGISSKNEEQVFNIINNSKVSIPELVKIDSNGINLNKVLEEIEKKYILDALEIAQGVKKKAADLLCINRTTLIEKMKKLKIN